MTLSERLKAAAPPEHLVRHDVAEILVEKPNLVKPGVRKGFLPLFYHTLP